MTGSPLLSRPGGDMAEEIPAAPRPGTPSVLTANTPAVRPPAAAIQAHLAFLARRRALRPTKEYRTPTDAEWEEFLGHFERRKVAAGTCGRAFGAPCIHQHSCLRCALHWPDPAQRPRIAQIRDNLIARIAEAAPEGWFGEAEGLKISLAGAEDKLAQIDRRSRHATTDLGMPATARQT